MGRRRAERRRLETHPKTEAAQLVEIREAVKGSLPWLTCRQNVPRHPNWRLREGPSFAEMADDELLGYGVPAEWLNDVTRQPRTRSYSSPITFALCRLYRARDYLLIDPASEFLDDPRM
jgi:hypothetical protein